MKALISLLLVSLSILPLSAYDNVKDPQRIRIREQVMSVYEEKGVSAGAAALEEFFQNETRPDEAGYSFRAHTLYHNLWRQAQLHTESDEWAESLYRFILEKSTGGDRSGKTMCFSGMVLITSLVRTSLGQGKVAQAREYAEFGKRITTFHGFNMELHTYPVAGPLFPNVPEMPRREYPIRYQGMSRGGGPAFLPYDVFYLHWDLKRVAYDRGDWEEAAGYADWMYQFGKQHWDLDLDGMPHQSVIHGEMMISPALSTLSDILFLHGYEEKSRELLYQLCVQYPVTAYRHWHSSQILEMEFLRKQDHVQPGTMRWLKAAEIHLRANKYGGSTWMSIRQQVLTLFQEGRKEEAVALMEKLGRDSGGYTALALMAYETGQYRHPDLEAILIEQLEAKREKGLKIEEPRLYRLYAAWLAEEGRWEEALHAQREAIRFYESLRIPVRALQARAEYIQYLHAVGLNDLLQAEQEALQNALAKHTGSLPDALRKQIEESLNLKQLLELQEIAIQPTDLQPRTMNTVTLPGALVRTRFSLSNPSQIPQSGVLKLNPPGQITVDEETKNLFISWHGDEVEQTELEVKMDPFSERRLYLISLLPEAGKQGEVELTWTETRSGNSLKSNWVFSQGDKVKALALTNASRTRNNPFYLVPIYQSLVRADTGEAESVPFRIRCSRPTRVEVVQESDQRLIYVDANGDGDLEDAGDVLFAEAHSNLVPEVQFLKGEDLSGFVMYLQPTEEQKDPIEIEVSLLRDGKWVPETIHSLDP